MKRSSPSEPFYESGLRFSCARCSACCRHDPGFVFLSLREAQNLAKRLSMDYSEFLAAYCRWIPMSEQTEMLSLRERSNYDCIFWSEKGCTVYEDRPVQCRTFPFWDSVVASEEAWNSVAEGCPGMNRGAVHLAEEIEQLLSQRRDEAPLTRSIPKT